MERFVEYRKLSKKAQKAQNAAKRTLWDCSPVSRVVPSKKVYNRKKVQGF